MNANSLTSFTRRAFAIPAALLLCLGLGISADAQRNETGRDHNRGQHYYQPGNSRPEPYRGGYGSFGFGSRFGTPPPRRYYGYNYTPRYAAPPCGWYDRWGYWHRDPYCYYGY